MSKSDLSAAAPKAGVSHPSSSGAGKILWFAVLILLVVGVVWLVHRRQAAAAAGATKGGGRGGLGGPVPVMAGKVAQKDVPIYLDGIGTVQAYNTVTVNSQVGGQLIKIAFTEGQDVKAGDLLAQIDPAPYQATLDQMTAKRDQDAATLANARLDLKRYADLLATDGTTEQTYDTQKALVAELEATVKADAAAMASAQVNLNYTSIHSPIDGRVGIRLIDAGNIVQTSGNSNSLVVLTQLRPIYIVFTLPETVLAKLHPGTDETNFPVLAVSRDGTNVLATGQLAVIDNQIDTTTGTIKLKAVFVNEHLHLWPGEFVNVRLLLTTRTNSLVVPASVVQRGPEGSYAFVIQAEGTNQTVAMQPVTVGQIDNGEALIEDGLQPGQPVVVDGQYKLQEGSRVNITWAKTGAEAGGAAGAAAAKGHHKRKSQTQSPADSPTNSSSQSETPAPTSSPAQP